MKIEPLLVAFLNQNKITRKFEDVVKHILYNLDLDKRGIWGQIN